MATPIDSEIPNDMLSEMEATMKGLGIDTEGSAPTEKDVAPAPTTEPAVAAEVEEEAPAPEVTEETPADDGEMKDPNAPAEKPAEVPEEKVEAPAAKVEDKPAEKPASTERDADLSAPLNPNIAPKTKQVIETFKTKSIEARNERDQARKELEETRAKLKEGGFDEATKKELEELRREIRSVNIERDPGLKQKYDARITANEERALKIFDDKFTVTPELLADVKKKGISLNTMGKYVKQLEDAGDIEAADEMREMLRENGKLSRDKNLEIEAIRKDYDGYMAKQKIEETRQFNEASDRFRVALVEDLQGIGAKFNEFKRPPLPAEGDAEAVKTAKLAAVGKYDAEFATVIEKIKKFGEDPVLQFRTAAQGVVYRDHVVPSLTNKISELTKQLSEAQVSLGKIKKAGSMTKLVSTPKPADARTRQEETGPDDGIDAIMAAGRSLGLNVE